MRSIYIFIVLFLYYIETAIYIFVALFLYYLKTAIYIFVARFLRYIKGVAWKPLSIFSLCNSCVT